MAMRKEPERRYRSVEQFSEDIERHLKGLPVVARPDTFSYRASKFVRRNRAAVAAACLVFLTLVGGIVATAWQARRAREQARVADAKTAEAQKALARTEKINRFMQSIFSYANPHWFGRAGGRRDVSVLEAMRDIERRIEEEFRDEPDLRADVYQQIGDSYRTQGLLEDAERNLRKALDLRLGLYGEDSAKVAESMYILSGVRYERGDLAEHERLLTRALAVQRRHPGEGNNLPHMLADYGNLLADLKNDYAGALAVYREALEMFRRRYGEGHYMVGATQTHIIRVYIRLGDYAHAEGLASELLGQSWPESQFTLLSQLAWLQVRKGDYRAAEDTLRRMQTLARARDAKPFMAPSILSTQFFMAYRRGDYAQALGYAEKGFAAQSDDPARHWHAIFVAQSLNRLGQAKRAEALLREAVERLGRTERAFDLAALKSALGESLTAQRRYAEAEPLLLEAHEAQQSRVLPGQFDLAETRRRLAELYTAWGRPDLAAQYREEVSGEQ
jgi:serine/threonine-protein kinase